MYKLNKKRKFGKNLKNINITTEVKLVKVEVEIQSF